jgi:hypothetical protein
MQDRDIVRSIDELVAEEHRIRAKGQEMTDEDRATLRSLEVQLDQCWDLLRQRRAREEFGQDPDTAKVRDADTVEHYRQ